MAAIFHKKSTFLLVLLFFKTLVLLAQEPCQCTANLEQLIRKTEENYAGFPIKVTGEKKTAYLNVIRRLKKTAAASGSPLECYSVLREYVSFFYDRHFLINYTDRSVARREVIMPQMQYYESQTGDPWEGIWRDPDSTLTLGVKKINPAFYKAVVIEAADHSLEKGLVYFEFRNTNGKWYAREFGLYSSTPVPVKLYGDLLQVWNYYLFARVSPKPLQALQQAEWEGWKNGHQGIYFRQLSKQTAYLRIASFMNTDELIRQLVTEQDKAIRQSRNLIIDLTGNGGGGSGWVSLLPYIMTKPITQGYSSLRISPENVTAKRKDLEPFATQPIPEEYKKYFPDSVVQQYKRAYQELQTTTAAFYPVPGAVFPLEEYSKLPLKVALLVDDFCGSSTEFFCWLSKQSSRARIYGSNTYGMMDYEGMSIPTALPYSGFQLYIPIAHSPWTLTAPIDRKGFMPDVLLTGIPRENWVENLRARLEKN